MKNFLMGITLILLWLFLYDYAYGKELPKEMSMATEAGEVVLTLEECTFIKMGLRGYPYAAYATDKGKANHEGCWKKESVNNMESVLIYFPEIDATAVYNPQLFKPRSTL
jgi:hypothetical protein